MNEISADNLAELSSVLHKAFNMPETSYKSGWTFAQFKRTNLRDLVPQRKYFKHRKKRMRKKLVKRFLACQYLAIINGEWLRKTEKRHGFTRMLIPPKLFPEEE